MQSYKKFVKYRAITALKVMKAGEIAWKNIKCVTPFPKKTLKCHTEVIPKSIKTLSELYMVIQKCTT